MKPLRHPDLAARRLAAAFFAALTVIGAIVVGLGVGWMVGQVFQ